MQLAALPSLVGCMTVVWAGEMLIVAQILAALVTRFKSDDMEKPVIRPYTPISDEGKSPILFSMGLLADST
jgi:hypothetical protein